MNGKTETIGAFDAKTRLGGLLDKVASGNEYIITRRGCPIARLSPCLPGEGAPDLPALIGRFAALRRSVRGKADIRAYIDEGRK